MKIINLPIISVHKQYSKKILNCLISIIIFHNFLNENQIKTIVSSTLDISYSEIINYELNEYKNNMIEKIKFDNKKKIYLILYIDNKIFQKWIINFNIINCSIVDTRQNLKTVILFIVQESLNNKNINTNNMSYKIIDNTKFNFFNLFW